MLTNVWPRKQSRSEVLGNPQVGGEDLAILGPHIHPEPCPLQGDEHKDPPRLHCLEQTHQAKLSPGWGAGGGGETCPDLEADEGAYTSDA